MVRRVFAEGRGRTWHERRLDEKRGYGRAIVALHQQSYPSSSGVSGTMIRMLKEGRDARHVV